MYLSIDSRFPGVYIHGHVSVMSCVNNDAQERWCVCVCVTERSRLYPHPRRIFCMASYSYDGLTKVTNVSGRLDVLPSPVARLTASFAASLSTESLPWYLLLLHFSCHTNMKSTLAIVSLLASSAAAFTANNRCVCVACVSYRLWVLFMEGANASVSQVQPENQKECWYTQWTRIKWNRSKTTIAIWRISRTMPDGVKLGLGLRIDP